MDIYYRKRRWKRYIMLFAAIIGVSSIMFTNQLVKKMADGERKKVELWAEATKRLGNIDLNNNEDLTFLNSIIVSNETVPTLIVDEKGEILYDRNFPENKKNRSDYLKKELIKLKESQEPIVINLSEHQKQFIYYKESSVLESLRYYPFFQLIVIILFMTISYLAFSSSRKAEQNLVWVGLAKETAHQLGTPISSLMAWFELLKMENVNPSVIVELEKDADRLKTISERFSKIGSNPELYPENIYEVLLNSIDYLQKRIPSRIVINRNFDISRAVIIPLSASLFSWVIENIIRNAVDSLENNEGEITITVKELETQLIIDIADSGKGIPKSKFKTIFNPGYTTKKRGWGLGLSLSKRIIENYHRGKLFIKQSDVKTGSTFRIILKMHTPS